MLLSCYVAHSVPQIAAAQEMLSYTASRPSSRASGAIRTISRKRPLAVANTGARGDAHQDRPGGLMSLNLRLDTRLPVNERKPPGGSAPSGEQSPPLEADEDAEHVAAGPAFFGQNKQDVARFSADDEAEGVPSLQGMSRTSPSNKCTHFGLPHSRVSRLNDELSFLLLRSLEMLG